MIKQPLFEYDKRLKLLSISFDDSHEYTALEIIYEYVKDIKKAHVCLSGGVDSQFWVRVCEHFNIPYTASTYLTTWDTAPINTDDYVCAQLTAEKFNSDWETVEIDMQEFYNSDRPITLAKKYKTDSQQICLHMEYLERIKDLYPNTTFLMGGEAMYLEEVGGKGGLHTLGAPRVNDLLTYENFFKQNNIDYVKDIIYLDAKMPSNILQMNLDYIKLNKQHLAKDGTDHNYVMERLPVKSFVWESIIPGTVNPLMKVGGFERIKKYFAMKTGIYNYFDIKYREPLQQLMRSNPEQVSNPDDIKVVIKNRDSIQHYIDEFDTLVKELDSKPLMSYQFDF